MTLSKNEGSLPDDLAHAINTTATATAARITSAYSAVVCPSSRRSEIGRAKSVRSRMYNHNSTITTSSSERPDGRHQYGNHREEEERGEDHEHEGEEHLHRRGPGTLAGPGPTRLSNFVRELLQAVGE